MAARSWVVARNRYLSANEAWSEGGSLADYPLQHWERWVVPAHGRVEAHELAASLRAKQQRLPKSQLELLTGILDEFRGVHAPDGRSVSVDDVDMANARRLELKQLLVLDEHGNAMPTVAAFNFLPKELRR